MTTHPYLRAFLAGVFVPTLVLPLILAALVVFRLTLAQPVTADLSIERFLVIPMALAPMVFGLWNMLYLGTKSRTHLIIGIHGAILPFLIAPSVGLVASSLGVLQIGAAGITWFQALQVPYALIAIFFLVALAAYYMVWTYIIGLLNRIIGIA